MVTEKVRLRLVFEGHQILKKSQKKQGLKKCWILVKPKLYKTISHLSVYLLRVFHLQQSSPHGLILSMDGFVLPPFESTSILKDNDIICVRKKAGPSTEIIKLNNGVNTFEQPVLAGVKLLANEEFQKERGAYASELEEAEHRKSLDALDLENTPADTVCKKRKASNKLQGSKRKKNKLATDEESPVFLGDFENDVLQKILISKDKSSDMQGEPEKSSTPEIDEKSECFLNAKRFCQLKENGKGSVDVSSTPGGTKKLPSRSARRKKAKRRWLREQAKNEKIELHQKQLLTKDNQQSPDKDDQNLSDENQQPDPKSCDQDNKNLSEEYQQPDPNSDADDDVVPVVIRPGHIRFTPLRKVDTIQTVQPNQIPAETFQWKGITSKKKGQKWGKEKATSSKWNNYEIFNQECSEMLTTEEEIPVNVSKHLDFDKLKPYTSLPKEGDVIAYRLIELSSSWTPEPTSFRVGKISWYNLESNKIMLLPVPEYPLTFEKKVDEDASALQSDTSLYEEDGSLQIDFSLLIDVRIIMNAAKSITGGVGEVQAKNKDAATNLRDSNNNEKAPVPAQENEKVCVGGQDALTSLGDNDNSQKAHVPIPENGKVNAWDEINQALSAKKAELSHVDDQSIKEGLGLNRWSYKALRSSALGPTMAFLRAQSGL